MSRCKITLYGLSQFDDTLFNNLTVPSGIDRDILIDNILIKGAEFEVLYSDPEFFKVAIRAWSNKWNRTFTKWIEALNIEYNPLENYDRIEEWDETSNGTSTDTSNGTGSSTTNNKVSAFNSSTYEPDNSSEVSTTNSNTGTTNLNNSSNKKGRAHGNIGVTTSQQMLQSELDIAKWNIYEHITDMFLNEFIIPIY